MKVLIIENEKEASRLTRILELVDPAIEIMGVLEDPGGLPDWMHTNALPDIVLVSENCLPLQKKGKHKVITKLTLYTAQQQLTYLAIRTPAINQFLSSPLLLAPAGKAGKLLDSGMDEPASPELPGTGIFKSRFFVKHGQRFLSVETSDIAYFFSEGRLVYLITFSKNKYAVHQRIDELQQMLNPLDFYRINRSYILSVKSILSIHPYFGGRFKLKIQPETEDEILVSRKRVIGFRIWLGE